MNVQARGSDGSPDVRTYSAKIPLQDSVKSVSNLSLQRISSPSIIQDSF